MTDPAAVLADNAQWVQAFRETRPERLGTAERMCIYLWDALSQQTARVEALEPIVHLAEAALNNYKRQRVWDYAVFASDGMATALGNLLAALAAKETT